MVNSTSLSGGNPGKSSGKTSGNSQTTGIEARAGEASVLETAAREEIGGIIRDILSSDEGSFNSTTLWLRSKTTPFLPNQFIPKIASVLCPGNTMNWTR
jgi:hypothetical protein